MSSRSATVLVIFLVACIAFCAASVFASMTGPISILPNESSGGVLDNLSAITDSDDNYNTYGYDDSNSYEQSYSSDDSSSEPEVETTTDTSQQSSSQQSSSSSSSSSGSSSSSNVETTVDSGSSSSSSVETTVDGGR